MRSPPPELRPVEPLGGGGCCIGGGCIGCEDALLLSLFLDCACNGAVHNAAAHNAAPNIQTLHTKRLVIFENFITICCSLAVRFLCGAMENLKRHRPTLLTHRFLKYFLWHCLIMALPESTFISHGRPRKSAPPTVTIFLVLSPRGAAIDGRSCQRFRVFVKCAARVKIDDEAPVNRTIRLKFL